MQLTIGVTTGYPVLNLLSFETVMIDGDVLSLTPCIDGTPLTFLVYEFETASGFTDPAGGYGGIVPSYWNYGPLLRYFRGEGDHRGISSSPGDIFILGCECGEVGCWPLITSVTQIENGYRWSSFNQPHRKNRNYDGFGPFEFDRSQYEAAVRGAILKLKRME